MKLDKHLVKRDIINKFDITKLTAIESSDITGNTFTWYKYKGKKLISPSKLTRDWYGLIYTSEIPDSILKKAKARGTLFHKEVEAINNKIETYAVDEELVAFGKEYKKIVRDWVITPIASELRVWSEDTGIAGFCDEPFQAIADCIAFVGNDLAILEYKFNSILSPWLVLCSQIQTTLAKIIIEQELGYKDIKRFTIHWNKHTRKIDVYEASDSFDKLLFHLYSSHREKQRLIKEMKERKGK